MTGERLSSLQRWILVTTLKNGDAWQGMPAIRRKDLLHAQPNGSFKGVFNVSLTRSIRGLCDKILLRAYSLTNPWKRWRETNLWPWRSWGAYRLE